MGIIIGVILVITCAHNGTRVFRSDSEIGMFASGGVLINERMNANTSNEWSQIYELILSGGDKGGREGTARGGWMDCG